MRKKIWNRRLPQGLGLIALIAGIITIGYLSSNAILFGTRAAVGNTPKEVKVTNIEATGFTISYTTDEGVLGSVSYGVDETLGSVALDERDNNGSGPQPRQTHHIEITNLSPSTRYFFEILSGDETFKDGEAPLVVSTAPEVSDALNSPQEINGKVVLSEGSTPIEGLVYISTPDSQVLSTYLSPDGTYSLTINSLLNKNLENNVNITPDTEFTITIVDDSSRSDLSVLASQTNPVPLITLSKNYDFTAGAEGEEEASESAEISPFPESDAGFSEPQILRPREGEELTDARPLIQGKSLPGTEVEIVLQGNSDEIAAVELSDDNGTWEFRPDSPLNPGNWNLTVNAFDINGSVESLTRSFSVLAEGSQFIEPSVSPTSSPSASPTVADISPTTNLSPTEIPTPTLFDPTLTPTPQVVSSVSATPSTMITQPPIPASGDTNLLAAIFGVVAAIGIGMLLFIFI